MKPFLLVAADFVKTGGMDRANFALAEYLAARGGEVHLVGHSAGESLRRHPAVRWHGVRRPLGRDALGWGALDRAGRRWARRIRAQGGRVLVNGGNCLWGDLNWVHYLHAAYEAVPAQNGARRAWSRWKHRRALRDERRALQAAQLVIANSDHTRAGIVAHLNLPPERVHTVYYGNDPQRFRPATAAERQAARRELGWSTETPVALFIGALGDRRKGFDTLFAAWNRLARQGNWCARLMVVGRGAELAAWRRRTREQGLEDAIQFLGFRPDVPRLLAAADLLVAPARYEAYGLGVQEALACGLPAIVSAAAGVAERMPPELAPLLLANPESADELTERLEWWRAHAPELASGLCRVSGLLQEYTWDAMARTIVSLTGEAA